VRSALLAGPVHPLDTLEHVLGLGEIGFMTSTEYQQLVEFLGRRFTEIDRRFDEADFRFTELRQAMLGHFDATVTASSNSTSSTTRARRPCAGSKRGSQTSAAGARFSSAAAQS